MMRVFAAGCDRLVHPSFVAPAARGVRRRLLGALLTAPLFISIAAWMLLPGALGIGTTFAFISLAFCSLGLLATVTATKGEPKILLPVACLIVAPLIAVLIAAAGGLQSPLAAVALALGVEAMLVQPSRRNLAFGFAAGASALVMQAGIGPAYFAGATASAWHWIVPLAYLMITLPRVMAATSTHLPASFEDSAAKSDPDENNLPLRFSGDGDLLEAGGTANAMLGVDGDLLLGAGFFERIHVADRVLFLCAFADLRDNAAPRKLEIRMRSPSSSAGHAVSNYRPVALDLRRSAQGGAPITGLLRDNGEVAALRAALAAAEDANARSDMSKGRFLAAVSHELRTPLNSIIGFSDLMLCEVHGPFADARQKENVAIIREAGSHLLAVVNSVLDVSKIESGCYATVPERFRFHEAVNLCMALMRMQADAKGVKLTTNVESKLGEINADRRAVQQMLINLISNAIKFTPAGGAVRVNAERAGGRLHVSVIDNGIGISDSDMERIGEPFAQIHNDYTRDAEGTGLGLALVKGLVALHEGTMTIDSAPGAGTKVTIGLPVDGPAGENTNAGVLRPVRAFISGDANGTFRKAG